MTLQLRYLQTLLEISGSQNSTIVFPLPMDLIAPLLRAHGEHPSEPKLDGERPPVLQPMDNAA